ncbi:hypothetical protein V6N13_014667 [Hibiscus sabdariffa]
MITSSKEGNTKVYFPEQNLERVGRLTSCKDLSWEKMMSFMTSSVVEAMISSNIWQSVTLILVSCTMLLAVVKVIKFLNPWHFYTSRVVKCLSDKEDDTKFFNLLDPNACRISRLQKTSASYSSDNLNSVTLARVGKRSSCKDLSWEKTMSSVTSSVVEAMISSNIWQS